MILPVGALDKAQTRARAHAMGLEVIAEKPESQEICFVPGGDYRTALRERAGWTEQPGALIDADGAVVGEHRGAAAYTVGQRQGLGVALGEPRYVSSIDAKTNIVTLGRREDLYRREFDVESVSFVSGDPPGHEVFECRAHQASRGAGAGHSQAERLGKLVGAPRCRCVGAGAGPGGRVLWR